MSVIKINFTNHESLVVTEHDGEIYVNQENLRLLSDKRLSEMLRADGINLSLETIKLIKECSIDLSDNEVFSKLFPTIN